MQKIIYFLFLISFPFLLHSQNPNGNYNPFVNSGMISPSPLSPSDVNGKGIVSFTFGNTGSDPLEVYTDQYITLIITLSYGISDHINPVSAIGGTFADYFSWSYNSGTFTAVQKSSVPGNSSGTISIAYKVTHNSAAPGSNGFNVNIAPAPYQTSSNLQPDDAVNSYTYTELSDYGDAPESYGSANHTMDFNNYFGTVVDGDPANQASVNGEADDTNAQDDEDGIIFSAPLKQGENVTIQITVVGLGWINAWIDWNADGDFTDPDEQIANNILGSDGTLNHMITVPSDAIATELTFARFRFSPDKLSSSTGIASGGEVEDYAISISASPHAPSVPTGLSFHSISIDSISISWNASTDISGVTGYRIYRDGVLLGTSSGLSYTDNTVSLGNTYTYSVSAVNASEYESEKSDAVTVTITSSGFMVVNRLSVFPNPSDGQFVIEINEKSGKFNLEITAANGVEVARNIIYFNESRIPLYYENLTKGVYFIKLYNKEKIYFGKLLIQK